VHKQWPCETRNGGAEDTGLPTLSLVQDVRASEPSPRSANKEADFEDLPADTNDKLNDITRACDPFQPNAVKPRHFTIYVKWNAQRSNRLVLADVVHFCDGDLVHVIDHATRLDGGRFTPSLKNPSAPEIWNTIKLCWIDIYLGPPDILQVDQGRNFNTAFIQTACAMNGIEFQSVPTEAPWRMGVVDRAHVRLELACNKFKAELAELPELDRDLFLSMAAKCVNDAAGPSGVNPTYAVFGSGARHFPAISKQYAATHTERVHAMETARKQIEKHNAKPLLKLQEPIMVLIPHYRTGHSPAVSQGIGHLYSKLSYMRREHCI
jgi:hypothetical protein